MSDTNSARVYQHFSVALLLALMFLIFYIAYSASNDASLLFGEDSSEFANNGTCSDTRFRGPGMGDIDGFATGTDASDCAALFTEGSIFLASDEANLSIQSIQFGTDEGSFPNDAECDDPRFEGPGSFSGGDDVLTDATDCRNLLFQVAVNFVGEAGIQNSDDEDFFGYEPDLDEIDFGDDGSTWANDGECDDPRFAGTGSAATLNDDDALHDATDCTDLYIAGDIFYVGDTWEIGGIIERGALEFGDEVYGETGEFMDSYYYEGLANERVVFDIHSRDFDTYLIVISPDGEEYENDDFEGSTGWSSLTLDLSISGTYEVIVSSYEAGETGTYALEINTQAEREGTIALDETGQLEMGDELMPNGEYSDRYEISALPGQLLTITLESEDFDAYLRLESPSGEIYEDDDSLGTGTDSLIEMEAGEVGTYEITVTSYSADEEGEYTLQVFSSVMDIPGL